MDIITHNTITKGTENAWEVIPNNERITFIGTGSAFNHENGNNSAFLEFNDTNVLLDCGHDVPKNFEKKFGSVSKIDNIWISHMHADHIGGLEEIAYKNKFMNCGKKVNIFCVDDIWIDLKQYLETTLKWDDEYDHILNAEDYFNPWVFNPKKSSYFFINGELFTALKTSHIGSQPSYAITDGNFIFTGDTKFINWENHNLSNIKYIFQDTQLQSFGDDVHATLPELLKLPEEIRSKIYCMHYGQNILDYKDQIEDAKMHIVEQFKTYNIGGE